VRRLLSTLAAYVLVLAGDLEIRASFPGRQDVIVQEFSHVRDPLVGRR
jgi:hypothetical protein